MAEAMLEDDYKSSHTNLTNLEEWCDKAQKHENELREQAESALHSLDDRFRDTRSLPVDPSFVDQYDEKRVVIQVPLKRRKISTCMAPKDIVEALNTSMSREARVVALQNALTAFDHDNQKLHDIEIDENADIALVRMIVFLEFKTGFRRQPIVADIKSITEEISMACQALEMVYRASSASVEMSFKRAGVDVLQVIVTLIDEEVKSRMKAISPSSTPESKADKDRMEEDDEKQPNKVGPDSRSRSVTPPPLSKIWGDGFYDGDMVLKKATKILGHYARVGRATRTLAHFPGLLGSILNLIIMRPFDSVPWEARLSCLWVIANLACDQGNVLMMAATPSLINALVNVGFQPFEASGPLERIVEVLRARSIASRALLNLSWPPENKIPMVENGALVQLLSHLSIQRDPPYQYGKSRTMKDIMVQTRRNSVGALQNLASAPRRSKIVLCEYNNGKILDVLTDVALNDTDERVINLAFAVVHKLANHDTAEMMVEHAALVLALKNFLLVEEESDEQANSTRSHASSTLLVLERSITPDMDSYASLRELLDAINPACSSSETEEESDIVNTAAV